MFTKILIANRGEIALRIQRTARQLGIRTVAVFSDADSRAPHVEFADQAVHIGPPPAAESYLDIDKIVDCAKRTGAEAIHPGYGFLSENADFASACERADIRFIGPSADVIRIMGSKRDAKTLMAEHGVPIVPGYFGEATDETLAIEAERIGFPVLIKASAGGGGRGMRLVHGPDEFASALQSARREAKSAFADDSVLLERYIERPRHIEVQIFGDSHGNVVHVFERDCSVQRRYQKVIEEAPACGLTESQRAQIYAAAVTAGSAAGYVGAGTVEFVVDENGEIYFIEMNTRLQVEHPVTEMITGQDLVAWQLRIAAGESLPAQREITASGHALELRLCAEDPAREFAPSTGTITHFSLPQDDVRVDHGIGPGLTISPFYDSMVAKLIVHADDRPAAVRKARAALKATEVAGVTTNRGFLLRILEHRDFAGGVVDTHFIESHQQELLGAQQCPEDSAFAIAALFLLATRGAANGDSAAEPDSPWLANDAFRLNVKHREVIVLSVAGEDHAVGVDFQSGYCVLDLPSGAADCMIESITGPAITARVGADRFTATVIATGTNMDVFMHGQHHSLEISDPLHVADDGESGSGGLSSPMPGTVLDVFVEIGQAVVAGTALMLIEAMKIEHTITAPFDGVVSEIRFRAGDQIPAEGVELAVMKPA
ncbi:MAG: acetyl/propionyl/methylcrotonyl-CoA carboxylase subunit alpha [Gammaproteobacteria bacterium]|nr:acetyl/propionyl/methylcrotonyl-CoA carboxylase subunit alpha [Gammaproteobacteria bacterium]